MSEAKKTMVVGKQEQSKSCFVIMPISDVDGYEAGHFNRVYDYIIKPACEKAGFSPKRADMTVQSNYIVVDILKQIINSDMAICDLSSRNSNVFFELGLRQAFNLKTVLIKDEKTPRSFDISGLRCIDYGETLRVDKVNAIVEQIANALAETMNCKDGDVNSLVQLLAVDAAKIPERVELSNDTGVILHEIQRLRDEMNTLRVHPVSYSTRPVSMTPLFVRLPNGERVPAKSMVYYKDENFPFNSELGRVLRRIDNSTDFLKKSGEIISLSDDDPLWAKLTTKEFND